MGDWQGADPEVGRAGDAFLIDETAEGYDVGGTIIPSTLPQAHAPKGGSFHDVAAGLISRTGPDHSGYFVPLPVRHRLP